MASLPQLSCSLGLLSLVLACGDTDRGNGSAILPTPMDTTEGDNKSDEDDDATVGNLTSVTAGLDEAGNENAEDCTPDATDAVVRGKVFSPSLEVPISGALVYVADEAPEPIPDGVYCAECVSLPCNAQFVLTEPDGSFELPVKAGSGRKLVVQKGEFRRVSEIDVAEGEADIEPVLSSLPGEWNPDGGMWIPRIAVVSTGSDTIYNILAKFGMGELASNVLQNGTQNFDLLEQAPGGMLFDNLEAMRGYHIIFVPCMAQLGMGSLSDTRKENIRTWVAEGGKFYVTDWANEYLYETFPNYQTMHRQDSNPDLQIYSSTGSVNDNDLLAWLEALPDPLKDIGGGYPNLLNLPQIVLQHNWSGIDSIPSVKTEDDMGNEIEVGHKAWVKGPCGTCTDNSTERPMTISADYGCGRLMFSTYHTDEGAHAGLSPQELVLLYIILEIGVCRDAPPAEPPPIPVG